MKKLVIIGALVMSLIGTESCRTTVVAKKPNPPAMVARPPQPRPDYVWIDGEWYRVRGKYEYRQGYWAAPRGGRKWTSGHWEQRRGGWYWQKGHWR